MGVVGRVDGDASVIPLLASGERDVRVLPRHARVDQDVRGVHGDALRPVGRHGVAQVQVLGCVLGRDHDRPAPLPTGAAQGEGAVVADLGDRPPVTVADPAPSGAQASVIVPGDDGISRGRAGAVVQLNVTASVHGTVEDQLGTGALIEREALAGMLPHDFDRLMSAEADELTTNRGRLEREQDRLMQAHCADAIPLAVLKREQDRILGEFDQVNRRLDAHHGEYTDARAHLKDALGLLGNCADLYARCDDANRRLCNQAFFTRVYVNEDYELRVENARPFEMLLVPRSTPTP